MRQPRAVTIGQGQRERQLTLSVVITHIMHSTCAIVQVLAPTLLNAFQLRLQ